MKSAKPPHKKTAPCGAIESEHTHKKRLRFRSHSKHKTAYVKHTSSLSSGHGSQPEKHGAGRYSGSKVIARPRLPGFPVALLRAARFIQQRHCTGFAPVSLRFCNRACSIEVFRFGCQPSFYQRPSSLSMTQNHPVVILHLGQHRPIRRCVRLCLFRHLRHADSSIYLQ